MARITPIMISALRWLIRDGERKGWPLSAVDIATPGTLRALERRGLITCDCMYATENVCVTGAGRALASEAQVDHETRGIDGMLLDPFARDAERSAAKTWTLRPTAQGGGR